MRNLFTGILIPAVCLTLAADSTGRISGKLTTSDGKPVPGAVILIERNDIKWSKELKINEKGNYLQVGLEPKAYTLTVTAPGFQTYKEELYIPLGDTFVKNITLKTTKEASEEALKSGALPVADAKSASGTAAFNSGAEFYNKQQFAEALPFLEKAVKDLNEAVTTLKDGDAKKAMEAQIPVAERVYGITLYEVGKQDADHKDLLLKAEPYLKAAYAKNPKDQRLLAGLLAVAKAKGDEAALKTYQAALDTLVGPRPEQAYNDGVIAFNEGRFKDAKEFLTKALTIDAKFADTYYLLGVVDVNLNDIKGAKDAFKKYLEIAPTGKKAGEVKEFLKELK